MTSSKRLSAAKEKRDAGEKINPGIQLINPFSIGDTKEYHIQVTPEDAATFPSGEVHPVYSTFALGRDAEWTCRLFVLDMKEEQEEGIGTFLHVHHVSPALIGHDVVFVATLEEVKGNHVICSFKAFVGHREIAYGQQGQKILNRNKINDIFNALSSS
jgi:predicted thioesterase